MRTVVVGVGLTNRILGQEAAYISKPDNLGRAEIDRLIGVGKARGDGALARFLRVVDAAARDRQDLDLVILSESVENDGDAGSILDIVAERAPSAAQVIGSSVQIPVKPLLKVCGIAAEEIKDPPRVIVVGGHTDREVLAVAGFFRSVAGCPEVLVSPHLVGSAAREAHFLALRHNFPVLGVQVCLDLAEVADLVGLPNESFLEQHACTIEPEEVRSKLAPDQKRILELLCMHWTRTRLRSLAGGFSGSLLLLADGWRDEAQTEPLVIKIDNQTQMRRELDGYYLVKDFLGKNVPTFMSPVHQGETIGVAMELAAMEGSPRTLQDTFEEAEGDESISRFQQRLEKSLDILSTKLYANTLRSSWVVPYREFAVHAPIQQQWLRENAAHALSYMAEEEVTLDPVDPERLAKLLKLVSANEDGIQSGTCLAHGDLNLANMICDEGDNTWFIDWTHTGRYPLELDFAKLESDVKFVISKDFDASDVPRLRKLEEYLLEHRIPGEEESLPKSLRFVMWDLRFRKILGAVRRIRKACFALTDQEDWLVYRVALLRYSLHTLSFDARRDRGECEPPQLMNALYSVESLLLGLVADDFNLRIRADRPESYPHRQRISIDEAPWMLDCEEYDPPYHVDAEVLAGDRIRVPDGWADPEDTALIAEELAARQARFRDDAGRPLNPRGRTGIAGRGLLARWGPNPSVMIAVVRTHIEEVGPELLVNPGEETRPPGIPKGFLLPDETVKVAFHRVIAQDTAWSAEDHVPVELESAYAYDARQTDHAWVETTGLLLAGKAEDLPKRFTIESESEDPTWLSLDADLINSLPSGQARMMGDVVRALVDSGHLASAQGDRILAAT